MTVQKSLVVAVIVLAISAGGNGYAQSTDVRVINPPDSAVNTVPVADSLPFAVTRIFSGGAGVQTYSANLDLTSVLPAGFRFIIDVVSVRLAVAAGLSALAELQIGTDGIAPIFRLPVPVQQQMTLYNSGNTAILRYLSGNASSHLALEPGQVAFLAVTKSRAQGGSGGYVTLQGHLLPAPVR